MLIRLNISDNKGQGLSIMTTNLQSFGVNMVLPQGPIKIPYEAPGLLNICSARKLVDLQSRIVLFYKYDSATVDCVKVFHSTNSRNLGFRLLQVCIIFFVQVKYFEF